jgi:membrane fusion protein (multidrug efflux system)
VVVAEVAQKTVPIYNEFVAQTDALDTVEIRARLQAFLEQVHFTEGSMVKKDQLLFTLDKREYEAQLQQARAQMAKAQADLAFALDQTSVEAAKANLDVGLAQLGKTNNDVNRLRPLAERRAVPQQDYDNALANQEAARADVESRRASLNTSEVNRKTSIQQAQAAIEAAKAAIAMAELNISYCTIRSPMDGLIGKREVSVGNLVGRGEATLLATVSRIDPLRVFLTISESQYLLYQTLRQQGKLKEGTDLELVLADGSVYQRKGRFTFAERAVDVKTGTLSLITEFPNPDSLLRPGMFGSVRFAGQVVENAILVPRLAVQEIQGTKSVLVVGADDMVALRSIVPGETVGDLLVVRKGVTPGERVIVEGIQKARPGTKVSPTAAGAAQPGAKAEGKPPERSGDKPPEGPGDKPQDKPAEKVEAKPQEKPGDKPTETKSPAKAKGK